MMRVVLTVLLVASVASIGNAREPTTRVEQIEQGCGEWRIVACRAIEQAGAGSSLPG